MAGIYFLNAGSGELKKTRAGVSLDSFVKNIEDKVRAKVETHLEQEALFKLVFKFRKHIRNDGYGITAKKQTLMSIRKWSGSMKRNGDGKLSFLFKNNAVSKSNDFPYVTTLYTGTPHRHYDDGYAARNQNPGLDKEKVQWIREDIKKVIVDEVKIALQGTITWVHYKIN